jgi:hypothetical protein
VVTPSAFRIEDDRAIAAFCWRLRIKNVLAAIKKRNGTAKHAEHANGHRRGHGALTVLYALGAGFLEKVYENALLHELRKVGIIVSQQHPIVVRYDGIVVRNYAVDLLVERIVLVELKVAKASARFIAPSVLLI